MFGIEYNYELAFGFELNNNRCSMVKASALREAIMSSFGGEPSAAFFDSLDDDPEVCNYYRDMFRAQVEEAKAKSRR